MRIDLEVAEQARRIAFARQRGQRRALGKDPLLGITCDRQEPVVAISAHFLAPDELLQPGIDRARQRLGRLALLVPGLELDLPFSAPHQQRGRQRQRQEQCTEQQAQPARRGESIHASATRRR